MPTANVYCRDAETGSALSALAPKLKAHLAHALSCGAIALSPDEVSVRIINVTDGTAMMAQVEAEVTAFAYPERVTRQDELSRGCASFISENLPAQPTVEVWLILAELGHSYTMPG